MEDEERAHRDAHSQEKLESLKASVAYLITSLLEQTLRNASSKGPSNRPTIFVQNQTATQPEEITWKNLVDAFIKQLMYTWTLLLTEPACLTWKKKGIKKV